MLRPGEFPSDSAGAVVAYEPVFTIRTGIFRMQYHRLITNQTYNPSLLIRTNIPLAAYAKTIRFGFAPGVITQAHATNAFRDCVHHFPCQFPTSLSRWRHAATAPQKQGQERPSHHFTITLRDHQSARPEPLARTRMQMSPCRLFHSVVHVRAAGLCITVSDTLRAVVQNPIIAPAILFHFCPNNMLRNIHFVPNFRFSAAVACPLNSGFKHGVFPVKFTFPHGR